MIPIRSVDNESFPTPCRSPTVTSFGINQLAASTPSALPDTPNTPVYCAASHIEQKDVVSQTLPWTQDVKDDHGGDRQIACLS